MAIVSSNGYSADFDLKIVTTPDYNVDVQEIVNDLAEIMENLAALEDDTIAVWEGKGPLGGGTLITITLNFINGWRIKFPDAPGPAITLGNIAGGNVLSFTGSDISDETALQFPIAPAANVSGFIAQSSSGTINSQSMLESQQYLIESQRDSHSAFGARYFWDPVNGDDGKDGITVATARKTFMSIHDNLVVDNNRDVIFIVGANTSATVTVNEAITITKNHVMLRGPGRGILLKTADELEHTITIDGAFGVEIDSVRIGTGPSVMGSWKNCVFVTNGASYTRVSHCWMDVLDVGDAITGTAVMINGGSHQVCKDLFVSGAQRHGIHYKDTLNSEVIGCRVYESVMAGIFLESTGGGTVQSHTIVDGCTMLDNPTGDIHVGTGTEDTSIRLLNNFATDASVTDDGTRTNFERRALSTSVAASVWAHTVYIATSGVSGTVPYINGTRLSPVPTLAEAITIATALGIKNLVFLDGTHVLAEDMIGWSFTGAGHGDAPIIDCNGFEVSSSKFELMRVRGNANGSFDLRMFTCTITMFYDWSGITKDCAFLDATSINALSATLIADSGSATPEPVASCLFSLLDSAVVLQVRRWVGPITLTNVSHVSCLIAIDLSSGIVTLDASDTGGTLTVSGIGAFVKGASSTLVFKERLSAPAAIAEAVHDARAYRKRDNITYDSNGFPLSGRERWFPDEATANAATYGGVGEGETRTTNITATPDGTFPVNPRTFDEIEAD